ncbi:hypothetical protein [Oceanobacillus chungangensis]|uniref:hypothetical protein n=1 Tax=Oceanobacillus chungangensis TaxID=1229152 RepID=UPI001FEA5596|nr:hypothetical protein [Oceanobacillus chungangensis]
MKKLLFILISIVFVLAACSGNEETKDSSSKDKAGDHIETTDSNDSSKDEESLNVDKGLLNVEVTIPASFFEGEDLDQVIADAKESGIKEVTENSDGSITYKMSKSQHKDMIKELGDELNSTMEELVNSEDFVSIQDVTANKSFSEFTMSVDQEAFENSFDGMAALTLAFSGMIYQLFDGANPDDYEVTILVKNADNGEIFDTLIYPQDLMETEVE